MCSHHIAASRCRGSPGDESTRPPGAGSPGCDRCCRAGAIHALTDPSARAMRATPDWSEGAACTRGCEGRLGCDFERRAADASLPAVRRRPAGRALLPRRRLGAQRPRHARRSLSSSRRRSGWLFAALDYRRAPEHKHPAALQDAYHAYRWLLDNAESIGCDPTCRAVVGDSSGATTAASLALLLRDSGAPMPSCQ